MVGSGYITRFRELNNQLNLVGKNVLVVGGTGGIGAAAAVRFAQLGASVTVAGRNRQNGEEMVQKMKNVSNSPQSQFYMPIDTTIMADVKRFVRDYEALNPGPLHTLLITSGGLNYAAVHDTPEGIEHNFAISYLGRFLLINKMLEKLRRTAATEEVRVLSVMSAGHGGPIEDLDDIEMRKPGAYSKSKSANTNSICNDFMVGSLTEKTQGENVSFYHLFPGFVATDILKNNGIPLAGLITTLSSWLATTPEQYAEVVVHVATSPEFGRANSGGSVTEKAAFYAPHKFLSTPGARERVWDYSVERSGLNNP